MSAQIISEPFPQRKGDNDMLKLIAGVFEGLPPVREEHLPPLLNPNQGQCVFCKRFTPLKNMPVINTGIVFAQEPLCVECRQRFKDQEKETQPSPPVRWAI